MGGRKKTLREKKCTSQVWQTEPEILALGKAEPGGTQVELGLGYRGWSSEVELIFPILCACKQIDESFLNSLITKRIHIFTFILAKMTAFGNTETQGHSGVL